MFASIVATAGSEPCAYFNTGKAMECIPVTINGVVQDPAILTYNPLTGKAEVDPVKQASVEAAKKAAADALKAARDADEADRAFVAALVDKLDSGTNLTAAETRKAISFFIKRLAK